MIKHVFNETWEKPERTPHPFSPFVRLEAVAEDAMTGEPFEYVVGSGYGTNSPELAAIFESEDLRSHFGSRSVAILAQHGVGGPFPPMLAYLVSRRVLTSLAAAMAYPVLVLPY